MSDYISDTRIRNQNLLIVEGKHEKNELFWLIFKCFPEISIDMSNVWIYGTNIYMLYDDIVREYGQEWTEDDIDLPFVISKKKGFEQLRYKTDFTNIILVFDYERHDTNFSESKILDMQNYFMDATDSGKLYINYPMIESYQHLKELPDFAYAERRIPVSMQPGAQYKNLVRNETVIAKAIEFPHKIEQLLSKHYGINDEQLRGRCFDTILNLSDANGIDKKLHDALEGAMEEPRLNTAKYQFLNLVLRLGYAANGKSFWQYMRNIFQQIIVHNICKANKLQTGQYQIEDNELRNCFNGINLVVILEMQNAASKDLENGFIWVLNTSVFFVAEYNFEMVMQ